MAKKEFLYRGRTVEELQQMGLKELAELLPVGARRKIKRGFTDHQKSLIEKLKKSNGLKTHCRDVLILPEMIGKTIKVHNGKIFVEFVIQPEMIGHLFGEYSLTKNKVSHSAPGVGATRSSSNISVK